MDWILGHLLQIGLFLIVGIGFSMWLFPTYGVWAARKSGEADLAEAQKEQMIQRAQADGRLHAAETNKQAAIIEASAVAAQIAVIGAQLTSHDLYLKWQWIKMLEHHRNAATTIYVPTEANLPILEAGRLK